ncbi:hypothetical protein Tco_0423936 [Tanacetum coccineum]
MENVLSTLGAANVLSSGGTASTPAGVDTASGSFPTAVIFTTASVTTPYTRRTRALRGIIIESSQTISVPIISAKGKGKEKMAESEKQLIREQGEKDAKIARAQAERELGIMVAELDRSNELIAKYMNEYEQAEADLSLEEKMELITELIKYKRNLTEIKRYQAQQSKPATKTEKRNYYMSILKSNAGWKDKDFRGMTFEQIKEKIIPVWKQMQDFVPMNSKLESKRIKRPGIQLVQESSKKLKTAKDSEMLKKFDREDLDRLWSLVKKTFNTTDPTEDKEKELWVELKRLYEPDPRDQLWALQKYMHDPLEWRLYDTCGVHHVSTRRGHEIFMLVEKDYPLSKGLTTMMLCNKLQVDQYSEMANELLMKIYSIANSPR